MSTSQKLGKIDIPIVGRFRLDIRTNTKKFALTNISSFVPVGKSASDRIKFRNESGDVDTLFLDRHNYLFNPNKPNDLHNIQAFILHPKVRIGGMSEQDHMELVRQGIKVHNPKFTITNVDAVADEKYQEEVSIIKVRGKLYNDDNPISAEKLIWMCSKFGISYQSDITENKEKYRQELVRKLDKYVQSSTDNAEEFDSAFKDMKRSEVLFYIKELMSEDFKIIVNVGAIYKIDGIPVGASVDHVINWFDENPQNYLEYQKMVKDKLRQKKIL